MERIFTREELLPIAHSNPEALVDIILALQEQVQGLRQRIEILEARLALNSDNSGKPPSSDGYAKPAPKSLREKSQRGAGGQPGHPGNTLKAVAKPDVTIVHPLLLCPCGCGNDLRNEPLLRHETRQVFDLPPQQLIVTEHLVEVKFCPHSGREVSAQFPAGVNAPAQYGARFNAWLVYLRNQQLIPMDRVSQMSDDLFGRPVSSATIQSVVTAAHDALAPFAAKTADLITRSPIAHADETGLRVQGKLHWLHVVSTKSLTWYGVHSKRGGEAIAHFGILSKFTGCLIHDCWKPYFALDCAHGLCGAHLLRELVFIHEELHQPWAGRMRDILLEMKLFVAAQKEVAPMLSSDQLDFWRQRYDAILMEGRAANPRRVNQASRTKRRGRIAQTKAQNLLDRLDRHARQVLAFLHSFHVPFTNNQAEQDIRMIRVQQKISGTFRTLRGAQAFAAIRAYLSTMRKNGHQIFPAITAALSGQPIIPAPT